MNTHDTYEKISPADPRLTAYAFGELEGAEHALIEAAVQADPALQDAVAELRGLGGQLTAVFAHEPLVMPADQSSDHNVDPDLPSPSSVAGSGLGALIARLPGFYYLAGGLAAAGFAVLVAVRTDSHKATPAQRNAPAIMELVSGPAADLAEKKNKEAPLQVAAKDPGVGRVRFEALAPAASPPTKLEAPGLPDLSKASTGDASNDTFTASGSLPAPAPEARWDARIAAKPQAQAPSAVGWAMSDTATGLGGAAAPASSYAPGLVAMPPPAEPTIAGVNGAGESYGSFSNNTYRTVEAEPLSTFSIDVDTASYANVRRFLANGSLPPHDAVRVEELINYFPYGYAAPGRDAAAADAVPFAAQLEVASAPWAPAHRLVRIGLKGRELTAATRPPANLVFLIDVSGSMNSRNKLPLVKQSLRLLVERLRSDDRVAIVTYAGNSGLALPSTPASQKHEILAALDDLRATGSTNGAMGIHLAYDIAKAHFATGGLNRVILCTDGDFNVGVTNRDELVRLIEEKARSRVFLSVFGFGMGNLKDNTLESLADKGNGAYGYIDTRREAEKVFVEQVEGTLATIAKDVKVQVEFNPARVASYRLIGYENRLLAKEDFNNDTVDAGDIGAGHTVTALYEIVPVGVEDDGATPRPVVDPLKYQAPAKPAPTRKAVTAGAGSRELLTVKIRYKSPEGDVSKKQEFPLIDTGVDFPKASGDFQFAAAVAAWGMLLRDSPHKGSATFEQVINWAENALGDDTGGYRAEFIQLVRRSVELR